MITIKDITDYIFIEDRPQKADLIFVFGARNDEMANEAFDLYRNKFAQKILISGGDNRSTNENEAERISEILIHLGAKKEDLILENKSNNTLENVLFSKDVIKQTIGFKNIKTILFVAKNFHCRRAKMTLVKHFPKGIKFLSMPYDVYEFTRNDWFENETGRKRVIEEIKIIEEYLKKGDIKDFE